MAHHGLVALLVLAIVNLANGELLPAIVWDPSNPMFSCDNPEIMVRPDDKINIVCPNRGVNTQGQNDLTSTSILYEAASLLQPNQKKEFDNCDARAAKTLLRCANPMSLGFRTIAFRKYAGSSSIPTFQEGKTYYLIGTSFRRLANLDKKIGGSCNNRFYQKDNLLRLKIRVCTHDEINVYKNCSVCSSVDCYAKACMDCQPKQLFPSKEVFKVGSKCYMVSEEQQCIHRATSVAQKFQKTVEVVCDSNAIGNNKVTIITSGTKRATGALTGQDNVNANRTMIYIAVVGCLCCLIGGILLGLFIMKRRTMRQPRPESPKNNRRSGGATVSFSNGGFVAKDCPLEIQPGTVGSPSKVYGNFD